ncbi:MAG: carboxypeptidase regulatory-like domain-containing protein [Acidobacteria bacterium]|nr:carboxypeptidase regulatory-like domain-containing protein [Acidobacteriota bacterium]
MRAFLLTGMVLASAAVAQQSNPTPPPEGAKRAPGLFKGEKPSKEDENLRSVIGVVRNDGDGIVEGAIVQIKDTKTLKVRSYITLADGNYRFNGLSTNADYEITARFQDQESDRRTLSIYDSRKQAIINLKVAKKDKAKDKDAEEK